MRKIVEEYPDLEFVQETLAQLTWFHLVVLMERAKRPFQQLRDWRLNCPRILMS
jgi:hypothetical protein